jgi:glycosyltransferase involved in cell wall biosynthesis
VKLSVIMCTYNGAAHLAQQLDSIAAQIRLPDEMVACDDGSVDGTLPLLRHFAKTVDFPVRIVENPVRLGSTANFGQGIGMCDGDIIVLADQDDIWRAEKLARIESAFYATPEVGALFSDGTLIDGRGNSVKGRLWQSVGFSRRMRSAILSKKGFDILLRANFVTGATLAFRGRLKHLLLPIPAGWVHDYWIASLLASSSQLALIDAPLIQYRCHAAQQLGVKRSLAEKWGHVLEADKSAYLDAETKWIEVYERLRRNGAHPDSPSMAKCQAIVAHMHRRGALPSQHLRRLPTILGEIFNGNYFRYSLGWLSILRDMLAR